MIFPALVIFHSLIALADQNVIFNTGGWDTYKGQFIPDAQVQRQDMRSFIIRGLARMHQEFEYNELQELSYEQLIQDANQSLDEVLFKLGRPRGKHATKIKSMYGVPAWLGMSYGGPAYFDPFTFEVVLPLEWSYSKVFLVMTLYHEMSHSRGFRSELEASFLEYLAMRNSKFKTVRSLASLKLIQESDLFLDKTFRDFVYSTQSTKEIRLNANSTYRNRKKLLLNHFVIPHLKRFLVKTRIQNDSRKYGVERKRFYEIPMYKAFYKMEKEGFFNDSHFQFTLPEKYQEYLEEEDTELAKEL